MTGKLGAEDSSLGNFVLGGVSVSSSPDITELVSDSISLSELLLLERNFTFADTLSLSDTTSTDIAGPAQFNISGSDFISLIDSVLVQFGIIFPPSVRGNIDYDQIRTAARSGDGSKFLMLKGSFTPGNVIVFDADGNAIDSGHT